MPSPADSLSGRRALVAAGSRGIGRAVASELRARGAEVFVTGMTQRGWGRMVFVASTAGVVKPLPRLHLSNVMRAGVAALAQTLALEAGPHGVTTHVIATGPVDTERHEQIVAGQARAAQITHAEASRREDGRVPVRRIGQPQELGALVAYLCTQQAGFITGATHVIDGGLTLT